MFAALLLFIAAATVVRCDDDVNATWCLPLPLANQRLGYQYAAELRLGDKFIENIESHARRVYRMDLLQSETLTDVVDQVNVDLENAIDRLNYDQLRHMGAASCERIQKRIEDACTTVRFNVFTHACRMEIVVTKHCVRKRTEHGARYTRRVYDLVSQWAIATQPEQCAVPSMTELLDWIVQEETGNDETFEQFQMRMNGRV